MERILVVSASQSSNDALTEILRSYGFVHIELATCANEARRKYMDEEFELLLINVPLPDEFGTELAMDLSERGECGVILIVKNDISDQIQEKVEDFGVFVVPKPISRAVLYQALKFVETSRRQIYLLKQKNEDLAKKMNDLKIIDRAKCLLIERENISEQKAHRYIEKQAMDSRTSKKDVAEGIIEKYSK